MGPCRASTITLDLILQELLPFFDLENINFNVKLNVIIHFLCPLLKKAGYIALHMSVGRSVGTSVTFSLPLYNLVMHGGILK